MLSELLTQALCWGLLIGFIAVFIKNYRLILILIKTFRRDLRGVYGLGSTMLLVRWATKNKYTVAKIFDLNAQKHPNKICFCFEDEKWTYKQVEEMSNKIGNFYAGLGLKKGDNVILFMKNCPEFVCIWLGLNKIGVCAALVSSHIRCEPLLHCLQVVEAKAVIYGADLTPAIQEIMKMSNSLSKVPLFCYGETKDTLESSCEGTIRLDLELKCQATSTPKFLDQMDINDGMFFIFTSGTTGLPKASLIKQHRFMMQAGGFHYMNRVNDNDIIYDPLPLYHATGGIVGIGQALLFSSTVVIRKRFSASQFWKDCVKHNVTVAQYIGETCRYLLAQPVTSEEKLHKVRLFGGNGLRLDIWEKFVTRFNISAVGEVYGSSEGNCNLANVDSKVGSCGFVPRLLYSHLPMTLIKIHKETGEPIRDPKTGMAIKCQPNETGELIGKIIKDHWVRDFEGYTDENSTNKKIVRDVFEAGDFSFRTGDIFEMDHEGYFYFKDRVGDTYKWKGECVSTTEVETILGLHSSHRNVVVYGVSIPNADGKVGMAAIEDPNDTLDLETLTTGIIKSLPAHARPLFIRVLNEIDMTGTFKLKKEKLREEGYNAETIKDKMYFFMKDKFVPLDKEIIEKLESSQIKV